MAPLVTFSTNLWNCGPWKSIKLCTMAPFVTLSTNLSNCGHWKTNQIVHLWRWHNFGSNCISFVRLCTLQTSALLNTARLWAIYFSGWWEFLSQTYGITKPPHGHTSDRWCLWHLRTSTLPEIAILSSYTSSHGTHFCPKACGMIKPRHCYMMQYFKPRMEALSQFASWFSSI